MSGDFYCDSVLNGAVSVELVHETGNVLAYHHIRLSNLGGYQDSKHLHFHVYSGDRVK